MVGLIQRLLTSGYLLMLLTVGSVAQASNFTIGETVFVAYPSGNIKDDAFIVGRVQGINSVGDYRISVIDYVEGHDYGVSCVPMVKQQSAENQVSEYGAAWHLWKDTTVLDSQALDYVVSRHNVMKLDVGKHYFVERNNVYIVFGRWKSDAPMLTLERLNRLEKEVVESNIEGMLPALALVKLHRASFYGEFGRPYSAFETIEPLNKLLDAILLLFKQDPALKSLWQSRQRDWGEISKDTRRYFLIEAIDKSVSDAKDQLYEEGLEQAGSAALKALQQKLLRLKRAPQ